MNGANKTKVIEFLGELADYDYQRRVWLASSGPEISSFIEAVCGLLDDSGLAHALDKGHTVFTTEIDALLSSLRKTIHMIDGYQPPLNLIEDPKMNEVRKLSAEILSKIDKQT